MDIKIKFRGKRYIAYEGGLAWWLIYGFGAMLFGLSFIWITIGAILLCG